MKYPSGINDTVHTYGDVTYVPLPVGKHVKIDSLRSLKVIEWWWYEPRNRSETAQIIVVTSP